MLTTEKAQSLYNDLMHYDDHSIEELQRGLEQAREVLTIYKDNKTAIAYIEAVEYYFKNKFN